MNLRRRYPAIIALLGTLLGASVALAQPALVPVDGALEDLFGAPVQAASAQMTFEIWDAPTGGTVLHSESATVDLDSGVFHHLIGSVQSLDLAIFDGSERYLHIVHAGEPLEPRVAMNTVAYAAWTAEAGSVRWEDVTNVPPVVTDGGGYSALFSFDIDADARVMALDGAPCPDGGAWTRTSTGWTCENPATSFAAGTGIQIAVDGEVSVNTNVIQRRALAHDCPFGIRSIDIDGSIVCAANNNTNTNVFGQSCPAGQLLRGYDILGSPQCVADTDTNVFGQACTGPGQILQGFDALGAPICFTPSFVDTNVYGTACPLSGQVVRSYSASGVPQCVFDQNTDTNVFGQSCPAGQLLRGFSATGVPTCVPDRDTNTTYSAGQGIRLSGTTFRTQSRHMIRQSCGWSSCGNGANCQCGNHLFMVGWQDGWTTDYVYCCQMWVQN